MPKPTQPTPGVHKDGSYYLRATAQGHADAIKKAGEACGIKMEHRKGPANHEGQPGTFDHFHAGSADDIRKVLEHLHKGEAGDEAGAEQQEDGEEGQPGEGGQHIHIHVHHGAPEDPGREVQKAHHEASQRTVNGRVVPVKAYDDSRSHRVPTRRPGHGHPQMLQEGQRPQVEKREDVDHHRSLAEASSLRARVASHEAKCKDTHHAAKDHHYDAATAHLRAAHAMISSGHDVEHPHVKAHLEQAQRHHDQALHHFKGARGNVDSGRQVTLDEAIAEADKRELKKAMGTALADLVHMAQRWNVRSMDPEHRHQRLDLVPGAQTTVRLASLASTLGATPEEILQALGRATGASLDMEDTAVYLLEDLESGRGLAKALHTVRAHWRPGPQGRLESVTAYQRDVPDDAHKDWRNAEVNRVYRNMLALLRANGAATMPDFAHSQHIGRIGCTGAVMRHIHEERLEAFQRDPRANPPPELALQEIAKALVVGEPLKDNTTHDEQPDRVWLTRQEHQVSVAPFWNQRQGTGFQDTERAWLVTGYRIEAQRKADMPDFQQRPGLQIPFVYARG